MIQLHRSTRKRLWTAEETKRGRRCAGKSSVLNPDYSADLEARQAEAQQQSTGMLQLVRRLGLGPVMGTMSSTQIFSTRMDDQW